MDRRQTVLIVDDSAENLNVLGELLRNDYAVRAANSGARALVLAEKAPRPDLVLLDVMRPEVGGYEGLERLRASPITRDIPVIVTTAMDSTDDEQGLKLRLPHWREGTLRRLDVQRDAAGLALILDLEL